MRITIDGRQTGRTESILQWMRQAPEGEHRVLVCHSSQEAMRVYRSTFDENNNPTEFESWQFIGANELGSPGMFSGVLRGRGGRIVLGIDNLDLMLYRIFGQEVGHITLEGS